MAPGPLPDDFDLVSTGWIRHLPMPAFEAYWGIWALDRHPEGSVAGDLDELGGEALTLTEVGLDDPYEPEPDADDEDNGGWVARWELFCSAAAARGLPMATPRDSIELMREIGLVDRVEEAGEIFWRPVVPVPLAEDLLPLSSEWRDKEAKLRWSHRFYNDEQAIIRWLVDQQGESRTTERHICLAELAKVLDRDPQNLRHGLELANDSADISVKPDPLQADPDELLLISVDWVRFADERIGISVADPDDLDEAA